MSSLPVDVIDQIASVPADLDAVRRRRPDTREYAQKYFESIFEPIDDSQLAVSDRWLLAAFVTRLTADDATAAYYAGEARRVAPEQAEAVLAAAERWVTSGPFGHYAEPGLAGENTDGLRLQAEDLDGIEPRLAAGLAHAHLVTYRLRETDGSSHDLLLNAGWSIDGIVTLSQVFAFLAFQQRVIAALTVLKAVAA